MSAAPVGLNVLEHAFDWFDTGVLADALNHDVGPGGAPTDRGGWMVTKITVWAGDGTSAVLEFFGHASTIEAGGCLELEPGGAFRDQLRVRGLGARMIVQYWYRPAPPTGNPPIIVMT